VNILQEFKAVNSFKVEDEHNWCCKLEDKMELERIKELIKLVEESEINEITIEENGTRVTIRKGLHFEQVKVDSRAAGAEGVTEPEGKNYPDNWKCIVAPMVGTFFRAPGPDTSVFVEEGDMVEEGQTVCILEAMKLMNEIIAEENGVVKRILVDNGCSVEYGQELFLYEPAK